MADVHPDVIAALEARNKAFDAFHAFLEQHGLVGKVHELLPLKAGELLLPSEIQTLCASAFANKGMTDFAMNQIGRRIEGPFGNNELLAFEEKLKGTFPELAASADFKEVLADHIAKDSSTFHAVMAARAAHSARLVPRPEGGRSLLERGRAGRTPASPAALAAPLAAAESPLKITLECYPDRMPRLRIEGGNISEAERILLKQEIEGKYEALVRASHAGEESLHTFSIPSLGGRQFSFKLAGDVQSRNPHCEFVEIHAPHIPHAAPVALVEEVEAALPKAGKISLLDRIRARLPQIPMLGGRKGRADVSEVGPELSQKDLAELGYHEGPLADLPEPAPYPAPHLDLENFGEPLTDLPAPERHPAAPAGGSGMTADEGARLLPRAAEDAAPTRKGWLEKLRIKKPTIPPAPEPGAIGELEHIVPPSPAAAVTRYTPSTTVTAVEKFSRTKAAIGMGALAAAGWGLYEYNRRQEQPPQDLPFPPR